MYTGPKSQIVPINLYRNRTPKLGGCQFAAHSSGAWTTQVKEGLRASAAPGVNL